MAYSDPHIHAFMLRLVAVAYQGALNSSLRSLTRRPPGRRAPSAAELELLNWYLGLSAKDQQLVVRVVEETASASLFHCLVLLDNHAGGPPLANPLSDFALCVNSYASPTDMGKYLPSESIRINHTYGGAPFLHDLLDEYIEDWRSKRG